MVAVPLFVVLLVLVSSSSQGKPPPNVYGADGRLLIDNSGGTFIGEGNGEVHYGDFDVSKVIDKHLGGTFLNTGTGRQTFTDVQTNSGPFSGSGNRRSSHVIDNSGVYVGNGMGSIVDGVYQPVPQSAVIHDNTDRWTGGSWGTSDQYNHYGDGVQDYSHQTINSGRHSGDGQSFHIVNGEYRPVDHNTGSDSFYDPFARDATGSQDWTGTTINGKPVNSAQDWTGTTVNGKPVNSAQDLAELTQGGSFVNKGPGRQTFRGAKINTGPVFHGNNNNGGVQEGVTNNFHEDVNYNSNNHGFDAGVTHIYPPHTPDSQSPDTGSEGHTESTAVEDCQLLEKQRVVVMNGETAGFKEMPKLNNAKSGKRLHYLTTVMYNDNCCFSHITLILNFKVLKEVKIPCTVLTKRVQKYRKNLDGPQFNYAGLMFEDSDSVTFVVEGGKCKRMTFVNPEVAEDVGEDECESLKAQPSNPPSDLEEQNPGGSSSSFANTGSGNINYADVKTNTGAYSGTDNVQTVSQNGRPPVVVQPTPGGVVSGVFNNNGGTQDFSGRVFNIGQGSGDRVYDGTGLVQPLVQGDQPANVVGSNGKVIIDNSGGNFYGKGNGQVHYGDFKASKDYGTPPGESFRKTGPGNSGSRNGNAKPAGAVTNNNGVYVGNNLAGIVEDQEDSGTRAIGSTSDSSSGSVGGVPGTQDWTGATVNGKPVNSAQDLAELTQGGNFVNEGPGRQTFTGAKINTEPNGGVFHGNNNNGGVEEGVTNTYIPGTPASQNSGTASVDNSSSKFSFRKFLSGLITGFVKRVSSIRSLKSILN